MTSKQLSTSPGTYILGATQISLQLLDSLSNLIPVPYVGAVIHAASQVIEIVQSVKDNFEGARTLSDHIYAIIVVVLTPLRGKRQEDIPDDTKQNTERLIRDLLSIEKDMQKVKKRADTSRVITAVKAALGRRDISTLLALCTARLDWAMKDFAVQSHIQESIRLAQMSRKLDQVHNRVENIERDMGQILVRMRESNVTPAASLSSAVIPPKPELFYGREIEVEGFAQRIVSTLPSRFGITGPGGIGKTSLVSAILEHPSIVQHFESRIHWSRCDEATSPSLLVEVIARSFRLERPSEDRLQDIKSFLRSNTNPRLLVLDNFETPWDIESRKSDIIDILSNLSMFSHLSVLVTMRGTLPGIGRIKWTKPELPPLAVLPAKAARDLYVEIDQKADCDTALETLLSELGHMPLAVTLMAKVGSEGETPTELLEKWRLRGTDVIHEEGGDRRTGVNHSIQLSLQSHLMRKNPEALRLPSVLAMLPGGIRNDVIQVVVPAISDPTKARSVLLRTSLVYSSAQTNSFHVLSPIRTYIVHHHPPTPDLWRGLYVFCCEYIRQHSPEPGDSRAFLKALAIEDANLEAILLHALQHNPSEEIIESSLNFTWYQYLTHIRSGSHIASVAVTAAERVGTAYQHAACLRRLGNIYVRQVQLEDSRTLLEDARTRFIQLGEGWEAADCVQSLGYIARAQGRYGDAHSTYEIARQEFLALGYTRRSAGCLVSLGAIAVMEGRYNDARNAYKDAKEQYLSIGQGTTSCLQGLGHVVRLQGRYQESLEALELARAAAMVDGDQSSDSYSLLLLGITDVMHEQYGSARKSLLEVQEAFVLRRDSNGVAECLQWLGNVDRAEGRFEEARHNLEEAHRQFVTMGQLPDVAECLQGLGYSEAVEGRYKDGRQHLQEALAIFRRLGIPKGVADCLTGLGEISTKEGCLAEAKSDLEEARASYQKMDVQDWWQSRCISLLAGLTSA
ncbi:hypothetical protein FRB94_006398 [Tulasnella sp. JGI-2019a]|nr:hypothetical protein FRB94_006398 [Tulasnella sp. JGI-2019a]KAG9005063.1 hypothetical protein FRB93_009932 [Tulasnella sp. JGI-2019a]